ncbi:MAG: hypothetical protein ACU826_12900 [Gammaproteobacteria bacterium]
MKKNTFCTAPRRPLWSMLALLSLALFGGGEAGLFLAASLAPDSDVAAFFSFLMLPAALIAGFYGWLGLALLSGVGRWVAGDFRRRPVDPGAERGQIVPDGSWAFVPAAAGFASVGGLLAGLLSATQSFLVVVGLYCLAGTLYGVALWRLARAGYLPFPDSD